MILLKIFDIKDTMAHLLLKESFDGCFLEEAQVTTVAKMNLSGRRNPKWYDEDSEKYPDLLYWREARPFVFDYIKGKRTPSFFVISLKIPYEEAEKIIDDRALLEDVKSQKTELLLHFRYEKDSLSVVTGTSQKEFTMDKHADIAWDVAVPELFKRMRITYEK